MAGARKKTGSFRLLLTGGGTGGHLFPAVAIAENLRQRLPESDILFVGTRRRLDRENLIRQGFSIRTVHSYGFKGKSLPQLIKAMVSLPLSLVEAVWHILRFDPDVVCGVGGYVTGPVVAAAWLLRKPTVIHEQNSVPGLANRKLGRLVERICVSLPDSEACFPLKKVVLTGNPVRRRILETARDASPPCGLKRILVLGGSQGARALNRLMVEVLCRRNGELADLQVTHQTGAADEQWVRQAYRESGRNARVGAFFTDMADIYQSADLVVSRAGATTLAELAVLGKPALLVPYPHAADDHQAKNARYYEAGGGALLRREDQLDAGSLGHLLSELLHDPERLVEMSRAMKSLGIGDAAQRLVDHCLELAGSR